MNLKNKLNLIRIFFIPIFLIIIVGHQIRFGRSIGTCIFLVTIILTKLNKHILSSKNQLSNFSKIMSKLSDKLLIAAALIALVELQVIPAWVVITMVGIEFAVTGLESLAVTEGVVIVEGIWDRGKNIFQIVSIIFGLLYINFKKSYELRNVLERINFFHNRAEGIEKFLAYSMAITLSIALIATIISGINYFVTNRALFMNDK